MNQEIRKCQNCKSEFRVELEDFLFYEKIKVPPPTWCPDCQFQRRMSYRNERSLYKRKDSLTGKEIISTYAPDKPFKVYEREYWWSDKWDPLDYGKDYNFSKSFFEQFRNLITEVPWPSLFNWNAVNSEYCNFCTDNKNCYLVFGGDFNENCFYSTFNFHCQESMDLLWVEKTQLSYENVDSNNCYKIIFSKYAYDCRESAFLFNCVNCDHCVGCVNLRNKSYCIFNEPYSKEDYENKLKELGLESFSGLAAFRNKFQGFMMKFPRRYAEVIKSINSTGDNIYNAKNCKSCFDVHDNSEDSKNLIISGWEVKDAYSSDHTGYKAEMVYDSVGAFTEVSNITLSLFVPSSQNISYSYNCRGSQNLFGCIGLRNKQYCILNKQYTKEEYEKLKAKIIKQMDEMPYTDKKDRVYKYGEFFPIELSPFAYNETAAQEHFPLTKEAALDKGYEWKEPEEKNYKISIASYELPDRIKDVTDSIFNETIGCVHQGKCNEQCTTAFKIIPHELDFYRKMNLPLPRLCPNCRHYQRFKQRNPYKLWHCKCQCAGENSNNKIYTNLVSHFHGGEHCPNEFETSYSPERPEIVYCEQCYQEEVV